MRDVLDFEPRPASLTAASSDRQHQRWSIVGWWLVLVRVLPLALFALATDADPDLWGHLRFGLDILRDRRLTSIDPYSFTQDVPWINHEWLHELISAGAYQLGGTTGLIMLKCLLVAAAIATIGTALAEISLPLQWSGLALAMLGTFPLFVTVRPQLWTVLFLSVECRILTTRRGFLALPILFAFWANLHGGWIVGAAVLALWSMTTLVWEPRTSRAMVITLLVASVAATLITPYGTTLWRFLAATAHGSRDIVEWMPLWDTPPVFWLPWLLSVALIAACARHQRIPVPDLAVAAALSAGGIWILRMSPLSVVANVVIAGPALARWKPIADRERGTSRWMTVAILTAALDACILAVVPSARCIAIRGDRKPDVTAAETLGLNGAHGRLVTSFGWGEYAIWHLAPSLTVSIDGRRETIYSEQTIRQQLGVEDGSAEGLAYLAATRPEYVWLSAKSTKTQAWLIDNGYRIDLNRAQSYVAVRQDLPVLGPVAIVEGGCFPGP
jgi:hypothetical protein